MDSLHQLSEEQKNSGWEDVQPRTTGLCRPICFSAALTDSITGRVTKSAKCRWALALLRKAFSFF